MTPREQGFLLLTSHLGDPQRKVLAVAQLRNLVLRVQAADKPTQDRELTWEDLLPLGYDREMANRIAELLSQQEQLEWYLKKAAKAGCMAITRANEQYPIALRKRLGLDCPGTLWAKGNMELLSKPSAALVGSRELREENYAFAVEAGRQAARQGFVLLSGNAKGADQTAQNACLQAGGEVISIVADSLASQPANDRILYISEDGFDMPFSAVRALSRNRLIHAMGQYTFVAQCTYKKGGTWDGTTNNLRKGYSPVFCYQDGSLAAQALCGLSAMPMGIEDLADFSKLEPGRRSFLEDI